MKIKTTKQMNLPQLIEYVWENLVTLDEFTSNYGTKLYTDVHGDIRLEHVHKYVSEVEYFTISTEEELTEDTLIQDLADVFFDPLVGGPNIEYHTDCIKNIKQDGMETYSLAIFYKDTLIWSKDTGIPTEGVIECS